MTPSRYSYRPVYESNTIIDTLEDDDGRDFKVRVSYDYYTRDGICFVTYCQAVPLQDHYHMTDMSFSDSVKEMVNLNENCSAKFECNVQIKHC